MASTSETGSALPPFMPRQQPWYPKALVLGPGGVKGLLELGALSYLQAANVLREIETVVGVSIGATIGLLFCCGCQISQIIKDALVIDLFTEIWSDISLRGITEKVGIVSHDSLRMKVSQLVTAQLGFVPTLRQLYDRSGKRFVSVAMNIGKNRTEYLDHETDPDLNCVEAVLLSMNIPILFQQLQHRGDLFIDGAFGNPYPVNIVDDGVTEVLGISIDTDKTKISSETTFAYLYKIIHSTIDQLYLVRLESASDRCRHLVLTTNVHDLTGISIGIESKIAMLLRGWALAAQFAERHCGVVVPGLRIDIDTDGTREPINSPPAPRRLPQGAGQESLGQ